MKDKFRIHYIITLIVTLLALGSIVFYTFGSFYSIAKKNIVTVGENSVSEAAAKVDSFLLEGMDVMQVTGLVADYMLRLEKPSQEMEQFLQEVSEKYSQNIDENFTGVYGVFHGVYLDGTGWVPDQDYVPQERPWYTGALEGKGKPVIVSPYLDAQTNTVKLSVSELLSDGESAMALDITTNEVQEIAEEIGLDGLGYGLVLDGQGLVVAHSDASQRGKNYLNNGEDSQMQQLVEKIYSSEEKAFELEIDGETDMVFFDTVGNDWYVVMIINEADMLASLRHNLVRNLFVSLLIFVLVGYFCTTSYRNRRKAMMLVEQLQDYQLTLEDRVREKTEENEAQNKKMMQMQENVIDGMATIIESRDGNTGRHVKNVKKYVTMMVEYMREHQIYPEEVDDDFVKNICSAAVLHDIGKIKVSDQILNKPGRFTPEEFEIMKTHSRLGGEIVETVLGKDVEKELMQICRDITTYHHEKWDGSGYPEGRKGEEIPLSSRIMAVADVFDALVSKRVYKDKMPKEEAFDILRKDTGTHFDPVIIEVFFSIREQVEEYIRWQEENPE